MSYHMVNPSTGRMVYPDQYKKILAEFKKDPEKKNEKDLNIQAIRELEKYYGKILDCEVNTHISAISFKDAPLLNPIMGGLQSQNSH